MRLIALHAQPRRIRAARAGALLALLALAGPARGAEAAPGRDPALLPPALGVTERIGSHRLAALGLAGFDPISYHLPGGPARGRRDLEWVWNGVAWRFAAHANRALFQERPEAYAPRLGGYDAPSVARGLVVDADPTLYAVTEGRLYLFRRPEDRAAPDAGVLAEAEARWPALKSGLVEP